MWLTPPKANFQPIAESATAAVACTTTSLSAEDQKDPIFQSTMCEPNIPKAAVFNYHMTAGPTSGSFPTDGLDPAAGQAELLPQQR